MKIEEGWLGFVKTLVQKWPIEICDDVGKRLPLVGVPEYRKDDFTSDWWKSKYIGPHTGHRVEYETMMGSRTRHVVLSGLLAVVLIEVSRWFFAGLPSPGRHIASLLVIVLVMWPFSPYMLRIARASRRQSICEAYLDSGHCPSCDYDLTTLHAEANGLTTCPECGGAWKVPSKAVQVMDVAPGVSADGVVQASQ